MPKDSKYCLFCGRLGECSALCRPLTVEDAITIPEVRALVDIGIWFLAERLGNMALDDALLPFLAAMEKEEKG